MGNRAVIAFAGRTNKTTRCVYVHWHGGRASVEGFLKAAVFLDLAPTVENLHAVASALICDSARIVPYADADRDNGDNGVYVIDGQWKIVRRHFRPRAEEVNAPKTLDIGLKCIRNYLYWSAHEKA